MSYERRRGYGGDFKPCPVEMGKEYKVNITETSSKHAKQQLSSFCRSLLLTMLLS